MKPSYELLTVEDNCYVVHRNGKIESKNGFLVPCNNGHGYFNVSLGHGKNYYKFYIHRLVAEAFVPNPKNLPEVNHKNGKRWDNRASNLEWCDRLYNIRDYVAKGRGNWERKPVLMIDTSGKLIKRFTCTVRAAEHLHCTKELIAMAARKVCKTAKGFIFEYESKP